MLALRAYRLACASLLSLSLACCESGGQSGGEGTQLCVPSEQPFDTAEEFGTRPADLGRELADLLTGRQVLNWRPNVPAQIPATLLQISDVRFGDSVAMNCGRFSVEVALHARSEEGGLDASFAGTFEGLLIGGGKLTAERTEGRVSDESLPVGIARDAATLLEVAWRKDSFGGHSTLDGFFTDTAYPINFARFGSGYLEAVGRRPFLVRELEAENLPALQRNACAATQTTSAVTFAADAALVQAVAKHWLVCSGKSDHAPSFAGLVVDSTGHYHELSVVDGALVAVQGFGHEGPILRRVAAGLEGSIPEWQDKYAMPELELSADGSTLRVLADKSYSPALDLTFQATDLPVRYAPLPYQRDSRAGLAACSAGEADLRAAPTSVAELREWIVGRWMFCRGRFGFPAEYKGITFAADGSFDLLDADGDVLQAHAGSFGISDSSWSKMGGPLSVSLQSATESLVFEPELSRTPMKMSAGDAFGTVLSAF